MKTGRNRVSTDAQSNAFLNWINRAKDIPLDRKNRKSVISDRKAALAR